MAKNQRLQLLGVLAVISFVIGGLLPAEECVAGPFALIPGGNGIPGSPDYAVVHKIDLGNGYKRTQIRIDAMPYGIALHREGRLAFLTTHNQKDSDGTKLGDGIGTVVVLDTISGKQLKKIETGKRPVGIAISASNKEFYIGAENSLLVYDLSTHQKKHEYTINGTPLHIVLDREERFLGLAVVAGSGPTIYSYLLNLKSDELVEVWPSNFVWDVTAAKNGKYFVFSTTSGKAYFWNVIDQRFDAVVDIGTKGDLSNIAASTNTNEVYLSMSSSYLGYTNGEIVVLDSSTGGILRRFGIPGQTINLNTSEYFPEDLFVATNTNFEIVDKQTGAIKHIALNLNNNGACCIGYVQVPAWVGDFVPDGPKSQIDSDRLFNWAEDKYPQIFSSPQRPFSATAEGYYFRCYSGSNTCLGSRDGNVHFLPPGAGMAGITNLGPVGDYLPGADADGY